ncbi:hypothetical protein A2634_00170 [Candidatus Amesbacteria bacterium RIFCSPHIGHO2_01_FULL_48_32]|uniref:Uncharacterized protein n=1 Tax=Candidatus Amesbacteria bacterium RIFCSPLOWO2_01_FULL_48_25 TaxID=1797259 RepID=A0A1F4ZA96_9BACT|nr:MAG: hypothetical protein A2634_00170 [Candidatus Amesbacteria bacterium RIFCSPHIGHO2_01_FULL_48_32]OGD03223.1 MAG: hypothetical protein A2989_00120 [Candidatus Amesbacteria bacterium RIFCSPLOWO2_01_FULL_48_25]HJZ05167.1 hypothetical protein [Patescibacteria group bacterium]
MDESIPKLTPRSPSRRRIRTEFTKIPTPQPAGSWHTNKTLWLLVATFILGISVGIKVDRQGWSLELPKLIKTAVAPSPSGTGSIVSITEVLPPSVNLDVKWGDVIVKMVRSGAVDKQKFLALYEGRQADLDQAKQLLESPSNTDIVITQANSGLILNLLWPLGIANKTDVLAKGPMGTQYKKEIGNFASTGGWTLGAKDGGKLFNSLNLISLTSDQESLVTEISQNIYRPCCGNSTYFPDCNHGAAMLGFIELAVASGLSKDQIYRNALALNSYWFPQTYAEIATYMKAKRNIVWKNVNPMEALGVEYSSGQGAGKVNKELQSTGLVPKVQGGGGCGV